MIQTAEEKAKEVELEARAKSLKISQETDAEIARRRMDLSREEERLQKRRTELDSGWTAWNRENLL